MYASDIINRNRSNTLFINSVLKKNEFATGKSIRIDTQKGGVDYQYMANLDLGYVNEEAIYDKYIPIRIKIGVNTNILSINNLSPVDFTGVTEMGFPTPTYNGGRMIDDGSIQIPMGGMDFYFFGTNYGAANNIYWNTNNAITFGQILDAHLVSISSSNAVSGARTNIPAIMLGNYDRLTAALYTGGYSIYDKPFQVRVFIVYFSDYYTDTTNLDIGKYQVRLIRELVGDKRQWVEVSVISGTPTPGYSNDPPAAYPSGAGLDANGLAVDPTKNSPYDITDGTQFFNLPGTIFTRESPRTGTNFVYQSNSMGNSWNFINNAYLDL
jgi:hypothetical protein